MKIRIRNSMDRKSYFRAMTGIGPAFGATWKTAAVFEDGWDAYKTIARFPIIVPSEMVNEKRQVCGVDGKSLFKRNAKQRRKERA